MTGVVLPFPAARRRKLVFSIARRALELDPRRGDMHIEYSIKTQADVMRRKGVNPESIERECIALRSAVRTLIWHAVKRPGEEG